MKKILLILIGGTICTALNEKGTLSVSGKAGALLKSEFENSGSAYAEKADIILSENLFILSENMTVDKWNLIIDTYRRYTESEKYDGIIFAHGTDTLAYSASLFSMILSGTDIPVFFVSSNAPLTSDRANGNDNFRYAVECICRGISPNVYVTYKNISNKKMYLHLASRLKQCENYSEDFNSIGAIDITDISDENCADYFRKMDADYPPSGRKPIVDIYGDWHLSDRVLMITPYVGLNYDAFDFSRFSAVLHGTFHSGTACAEMTEASPDYGSSSILHMIDLCAAANTDMYYSPSKMTGEIYDTVRIIGSHTADGKGVNFLYGCTNEAAYAKLILAYSVLKDKSEIPKFIETQCNYEFFER